VVLPRPTARDNEKNSVALNCLLKGFALLANFFQIRLAAMTRCEMAASSLLP